VIVHTMTFVWLGEGLVVSSDRTTRSCKARIVEDTACPHSVPAGRQSGHTDGRTDFQCKQAGNSYKVRVRCMKQGAVVWGSIPGRTSTETNQEKFGWGDQ
jgi:hypothetical protein